MGEVNREFIRWLGVIAVFIAVVVSAYQCSEQNQRHEIACIEQGMDRWCNERQ